MGRKIKIVKIFRPRRDEISPYWMNYPHDFPDGTNLSQFYTWESITDY